jgi:hypothetical protein
MKRLLVLLLLCGAFNIVNAQTSDPIVIKEWNMLAESKTRIDVSYRIVKCDSVIQIHFMVFNESPNDQSLEFDLTVTGSTEEQTFTKNIKYAAMKAAIVRASCDNNDAYKVLKVTIPAGYDPTQLTLKVNFKY